MMPKLRTSWSVQGRRKEYTEGLKTKYGKCEPASTESATLHRGLENASAGSGHELVPTRKVFFLLLW